MKLSVLTAIMVGYASPYSSPVLDDIYEFQADLIKPRYTSLTYEPNTNYQICSCDLVAESCDPFCCCDQSCPKEITDKWSENESCANVEYDSQVKQVKHFSRCFKMLEQYKFNNEKGLNTYFDPFLKLVCVAIDNAP